MRMYEGDSCQFKVPVSAVLHQKREDMVVFLASMSGVEFRQLTKYGPPEVLGGREGGREGVQKLVQLYKREVSGKTVFKIGQSHYTQNIL